MIIVIGKYTTHVDKKYYLKFKDKHWSIALGWNDTPYVLVGGKSLSRTILGTPKGLIAEHRNHNTLDNRRRNLRNATRSQNQWNRKRTFGASKYKGVSSYKGGWMAQLDYNKRRVYIGFYKEEDQAARAYNKKAKELFGEYACLNAVKRSK